MRTLITRSALDAARIIRSGGIVAFPTETVYGLGADVFNESAIAKIFEAKRRPADNPLIVHIARAQQVGSLVTQITASAAALIQAFFPGPLTVVLERSALVPKIASAGLDTVGIRMPRSPLAHEFLVECGTPVAAPSANISGRPSPTTWKAVYEDLDGRIDCILQGDPTEIGIESTVVDCTEAVPIVLRLGAVSLEEIREVIPDAVFREGSEDEVVRSPGLRHRHYSPKATVSIVDELPMASPGSAYIGISVPSTDLELIRVCKDVREYAHRLFEFFRECDRRGIKLIYCERVDEVGSGRALMDRIRRAAG